MGNNIIKAYAMIDEEHRLDSTLARKVEFLTTIEILSEYISAGTNVLDCGCGVGAYSTFIAERGSKVTAIDVVPEHIDKLKNICQDKQICMDAFVGNSIDMPFANETFDVVLCMGPLYHLPNFLDRRRCIHECIRVTKPNGIIIIAYISPFSVFPCVIRGDISRISNELVTKIIDDKLIRNDDAECFWTDMNFYNPDEMEEELSVCGLKILDHIATDGQSIPFQSVINTMNDEQFSIWFEYHKRICRERCILGISNHGLIVCKKEGL